MMINDISDINWVLHWVNTTILETFVHCEGFGSSPGSRVAIIATEIKMPSGKKDGESIVQVCSSVWHIKND